MNALIVIGILTTTAIVGELRHRQQEYTIHGPGEKQNH